MKKLTYDQKTKIYGILCLIFLTLALVTLFSGVNNMYYFNDSFVKFKSANFIVFRDGTMISDIWFKCVVGALIVITLVFFVLTTNNSNYHRDQQTKLRQVEDRKLFRQVINLLRANLFDQAVEEYNKVTNKLDIEFLYGLLLGMGLMSDDRATIDKANERLQKVLDEYDPDKVE